MSLTDLGALVPPRPILRAYISRASAHLHVFGSIRAGGSGRALAHKLLIYLACALAYRRRQKLSAPAFCLRRSQQLQNKWPQKTSS